MQNQASKVARGLRSFGNQIAKTATSAGELSFEVQGATKSIALMTEDGNLKSTYDVLKEISAEWDNMTSAERQALGISLAGKTQFEVFTSVLNNFEGAEKALNLAINAEGSAWRENARYMESVEAKFQALKTATENLVLGEGGLNAIVKRVLELSTAVVKFIDNIGGLTTVLATLIGTLAVLNASNIAKGIISLTTTFNALKSQLLGTISVYQMFGEVVISTNTAITLSAGAIGALIVVLTALAGAIFYASKAYDRAIEKAEEANKELDTQKNKVNELEKELNESMTELEKMKALGQIDLINDKQLRDLSLQTIELERQLALEKSILATKEAEAEVDARRAFNKNASLSEQRLGGLEGAKLTSLALGGTAEVDTTSQYYVSESDALNKRVEGYIKNKEALDNYILSLKESGEETEENNRKIDEALELSNQYRDLINNSIEDMDKATSALSNENEYRKAYIEIYQQYTDTLLEGMSDEERMNEIRQTTNDWLEETIETLGLTEEQQSELSFRIQEATKDLSAEDDILSVVNDTITQYESELELASQVTQSWSEQIDELQSVYSTLSSAVDEYNSSQGMSIDTLQSLLQLSPEYLSMLDFEKGKLILNKQAIMEKVTAQINEAKAMVYAEAIEQLKALTEEKTAKATDGATASLDRQTDALNRNSQALDINNEKEIVNWTAKARQAGVNLSEIQKVISDMRTKLKLINSVTNNVGINFDKAMSTGKETTDKANKSLDKTNQKLSKTNTELEKLKENVQDLKDDISEDDKVIGYINDKLDEEIDKLEEARDKEVEIVEAQIEALEEKYKKEEELSKERIKSLEEERDALIDNNKILINQLEERQNAEEEYWNKKIQALKDQNQALEDQADLERLLENLQKAKDTKIRVYKEGQGFVWDTDTEAVSKAQRELEAYNRKKSYEKQLADLEKFKKDALNNYEQQINDLKTLNDNIKNQYDNQISLINKKIEEQKKAYENEKKLLEDRIKDIKNKYQVEIDYLANWKKKFNEGVNAYEKEQLRLLALERTGIDFESANWKERLSNLDGFVASYTDKLKKLGEKEKELQELEKRLKEESERIENISSTPSTPSQPSQPSGGNNNNNNNNNNDGGGGGVRYKTVTVWTAGSKEFADRTSATAYIEGIRRSNSELDSKIAQTRNSSMPQSAKDSQIKYYESQKQSVPSLGSYTKQVAYASGVASIGANQFAIVGEDPNKEIVIGSKLNGLGLNLAKGTGIVNAKSTGTLAGLFNMLGGELSKGFNGSYNLSNTNTQSSQNIHIDNISLPQVRDAEDFVDALSNFNNIMTQKAYAII